MGQVATPGGPPFMPFDFWRSQEDFAAFQCRARLWSKQNEEQYVSLPTSFLLWPVKAFLSPLVALLQFDYFHSNRCPGNWYICQKRRRPRALWSVSRRISTRGHAVTKEEIKPGSFRPVQLAPLSLSDSLVFVPSLTTPICTCMPTPSSHLIVLHALPTSFLSFTFSLLSFWHPLQTNPRPIFLFFLKFSSSLFARELLWFVLICIFNIELRLLHMFPLPLHGNILIFLSSCTLSCGCLVRSRWPRIWYLGAKNSRRIKCKELNKFNLHGLQDLATVMAMPTSPCPPVTELPITLIIKIKMKLFEVKFVCP